MSSSLHRPLILGVWILALAGCVCAKKSDPPERPEVTERRILERLQQVEWRRVDPDGWLVTLLAHTRPKIRARAALAVGRMGLVSSLDPLLALVVDRDPAVRRSAAFALRLLVLDTPRELGQGRLARRVQAALAQRLARERDRQTKRALIETLGWIGDADVVRRLERHLRGETATSTLTALLTLARRGKLHRDKASLLLPLLRSGRAGQRTLAARTIWRLGPPLGKPFVDALLRIGGDGERDQVVWAIRALTVLAAEDHVDWLAARLTDHRPAVQVAAARALRTTGEAGSRKIAAALPKIWRSVSANHFRLTGPELHAVLAGLDALRPQARRPQVRQLAELMLELSDATDAAVTYRPKEAHSVDLVHCAAAMLRDSGDRRLDRTRTCGTAGSLLTPEMRRIQEIGLATVLGDRQARLEHLAPLLRDDDARIRRAAAWAFTLTGSTDANAIKDLEAALGDPDPTVLTAAANAIFVRRGPRDPVVTRALLRRLEKLDDVKTPQVICAVARALGALRASAASAPLQRLLSSCSRSVRSCAARTLHALSVKVTPTRRWRPRPAFPFEVVEPLPVKARIVTTKGVIHLRLLPDRAAAAVTSFARLAWKHYFKDTRVWKLSPFRQLWAGDPRGDGWGGPGYTLPCELSPTPFVRGSVGMAIREQERDTAGSQFFITMERQPALDGRFTQLAVVTEGMEVVERLQPGDLIRNIYVDPGVRRPAAPSGGRD